MNKNRIVTALDIGSFKITALIAQVSTDQVTFEETINIVGAATAPSKGVKKGQIVDLDDTVESTIIAVEAAERMAGYNLDTSYVSIGGGHIMSQNSTGVVAVSDPEGEIVPGDVERVIEGARAVSLPASRNIVHVLPREYIVDGESGVRDPVGMSGVRLEVDTHLITASSSALKNLSKAVAEVGVDITGMIFSGLAASESVLSRTEQELGCVLVDIGGGTTSVVAFVEGGIAYSGTIPIGARNVTNDLAIGLRISLESAERVKVKLCEMAKKEGDKKVDHADLSDLGATESKKVSVRTLTEGIIRPRLNEIFTMVKLDLDKAGLLNRVPSGVVVTGGGASTVGALSAAKRVLGMTARIGVPEGVGGLVDDILNPSFSTPIGLILRGARETAGREGGSLISKKIKFPTKGLWGKVTDTFRDLLP